MKQVDIVLPSQHFGSRRMQTPEERLMMAVLQDALDCIQKQRDRRVFDEAKRWFLADEKDWPYSFEHICAALELNANAVRRRLRVGPGPQAVSASSSSERFFFERESWRPGQR